MTKKILFILMMLTFCVPVAFSFGQYKQDVSYKHAKVTAPDFSLYDIQGKIFRLSSQRGNPVVMFFGTTWCPACRAEMPQYKALYNKYAKSGLKFLYIDINESSKRVTRFAKENSFPYQVLVDPDGGVANDYNIIGVPTIILVDKTGRILSVGHSVKDLPMDAIFPVKN